MESSSINFCQTKLISVCNANDKYQQKNCVFYTKSSGDEHCMFFVFNEFCDNPEAQRHARESVTNE